MEIIQIKENDTLIAVVTGEEKIITDSQSAQEWQEKFCKSLLTTM